MAGPIATSAFNRLGHYASSPGTGPLLHRTRRFFSSGGKDHCRYSLCLPTRLALVALVYALPLSQAATDV